MGIGGQVKGWTFTWQRGHDALRDPAVQARWTALADRADAGIFQLPVMVCAWFDTKGRALGDEPVLCWASHEDGAEGLMPFSLRRGSFRNAWERRLVGVGEPHFDYQEPLVLPGSKVTGLISALDHELHEQGDWCEKFSLYRFRLQTLTEFRADAAQVSPCIRLDPGGGLDAFLRARSSHFLAGIARQRRQLAAVGNVTLQTFLPDQSLEAEGELERMIAAYEDVHAGEGSAGLFRAPGTREFYLRLLTVLLPAGLVQFSVLRAGGIACSWVVGFLCRGVFSYYKPVYARQYARLSPGKLHLSMLTEHGMQAGWRAIDLGPGVEPYKKWWTDEAVPLGMVEGRTRTLRSRVGRILSGLKARR